MELIKARVRNNEYARLSSPSISGSEAEKYNRGSFKLAPCASPGVRPLLYERAGANKSCRAIIEPMQKIVKRKYNIGSKSRVLYISDETVKRKNKETWWYRKWRRRSRRVCALYEAAWGAGRKRINAASRSARRPAWAPPCGPAISKSFIQSLRGIPITLCGKTEREGADIMRPNEIGFTYRRRECWGYWASFTWSYARKYAL